MTTVLIPLGIHIRSLNVYIYNFAMCIAKRSSRLWPNLLGLEGLLPGDNPLTLFLGFLLTMSKTNQYQM